MEESQMFQRISERLHELGMSERKASMLAVGNPDLVRNLKRHPQSSPRSEHLQHLAAVLGVTESWLLGSTEEKGVKTPHDSGVRFGGVVEAGTWRINDETNQDAALRRVPLPPDPRYPATAQYAFQVVGDSMTEAGIFEGHYVLAVDLHAWQRLHGEPVDGKLVVVARTRNGDPERELTVKRLASSQPHGTSPAKPQSAVEAPCF